MRTENVWKKTHETASASPTIRNHSCGFLIDFHYRIVPKHDESIDYEIVPTVSTYDLNEMVDQVHV